MIDILANGIAFVLGGSMILNIEKPTEVQLQPLLELALKDVDSVSELKANHLESIYSVLRKNPRMYRNYGFYWWAIKDALIAAGYEMGLEVEELTRQHFSYDNLEYLLLAAWAYQDHRIGMGYIYSNNHKFEVNEQEYEYHLEDLNMETMIINTGS